MSVDVGHDPFPFLEELRRRGRVVRGRSAVVSAHYDVCAQVLSDPASFSSRRSTHRASGGVRSGVSAAARPAEFAHQGVDVLNGIDIPFAGALIATDPPEHTRLRALVARAFRAEAVAELRTDIEGLANGLLDGLTGRAAVDLVGDYAKPLGLMIIGDVLGVPSADWPQVRSWADDLFAANEATTAPQRREALHSQHALRRYLDDLLSDRAQAPGTALIDSMLGPIADSEAMSLREAGSTALLVLQAGYETAATVIGNAIHALGRHPGQVEILLARPELWQNAVEEVMRWNPAVLLATRVARADTTLAGHTVAAGGQVVLALAGANRDPEVFDAPDIFDVERENAAAHLGMGAGSHACLAGGLARLETEVAVQRLFERFPNLRFASPPVRTSGGALRGFVNLPIRLGRPARRLE